MLNAIINQGIGRGCNWNGVFFRTGNFGNPLYSELETLMRHEATSLFAICCFGPQKTAWISLRFSIRGSYFNVPTS
jgi:hypothetical protein